MKHEEARDLLADYALDLIDRESQVDIAGHVDQCEVCHAELRLYGQAARALATLASREPSRITAILEPRPLTADESSRIMSRARGLEPLPRPHVPIAVSVPNGHIETPVRPPSRRSRWGLFGRSHRRGEPAPREDDFGTDSFAGLFSPPASPEARYTGERPALLAEAAAASAPPQPREAPQKEANEAPMVESVAAPSAEPVETTPASADAGGAAAPDTPADLAVFAGDPDAPVMAPPAHPVDPQAPVVPPPPVEPSDPEAATAVELTAAASADDAEATETVTVTATAIEDTTATLDPGSGVSVADAPPEPQPAKGPGDRPEDGHDGAAIETADSASADDFGDPFAPEADELPVTPPSRRGRRFIGRDRRPETRAPLAQSPQPPPTEPGPPLDESPRAPAPPPAGRRRFLGRRRELHGTVPASAGDDFATDSFAGLFDEPVFEDDASTVREADPLALVLDRHAGDDSSDSFADLFAEPAVAPLPQPAPVAVRTGRGWITATILFALVTAGLIAGGVVGFFILTDYRNDNAELESKQQALAMQIGFTGENDIQGIAYLESPDYTRGFLRLDNLPIPPKGQAYVLWADGAAGLQMIREVRVTRDERLYLDLTRLPKNLSRLFFTEEEQGFRGKEPKGRVVATGVPPFVP